MSGPETQKPDDQLLDQFLAGEGAVHGVYRESASERAPARLDAVILQTALSAAKPAPRRRWQTPMAAVAVMVLSFGVLLQVQRDPIVQKELMEQAAPPIAQEAMQDTAKAHVMAEAAPVREIANAEQKQESVAVAKSKSSPPPEKRRAAPLDTAPTAPPPVSPPPAMAMADAPSPAPEAAAMGAMASESMPRQQRLAAAAAPMAKASRAPRTSMLMSPRDADHIAVASAMERWAQSCVAESLDLDALRQWRGLALSSWLRQADQVQVQTTLLFAPELTGEAIKAALGALAEPAVLPSSQCPQPITRGLRPAGEAWALVCECRLDAE